MKNRLKFGIHRIILMLIFLCPLWIHPSEGETQILLVPTAPSFSLHEPVTAQLTIQNHTEESISIDLGRNNKTSLEITVVTPDGARLVVTPPEAWGLAFKGTHTIEAGDEYSQSLLLNEWHSFDKEGTFNLELRLKTPPHNESGVELKSRVATAQLTVTPFDSDSLQRRFESLLEPALEQHASRADAAARALSAVRHPLVIPYLEEMLERGYFGKRHAIKSLGQMITPESAEVLIETLSSRYPDDVLLAQAALRRMLSEEKISGDLAERVRTAISSEKD